MDKNKIKVLGFAGSLRQGSYNKALLRSAADLVPDDMQLEISDLEGIPAFNQDTERDMMPAKVREFKSKIRDADAILIATPEYNYSVPGVLKNAIDWASRPYGDNPFDGNTSCHNECLCWYVGRCKGSVSPSPDLCFFEYASYQHTGGCSHIRTG